MNRARRQPSHGLLALVAALAGVVAWLRFFDWGEAALDTFDWSKELAYLEVLKDAVRRLELPLHTSRAFQETHRFLANPEIPLSPQLVLLRWLDARTYAIVNWCLLSVVGVFGTIALARRMRLGALATAFLLLVIGWNGHLVAHVAVGHSMWAGYFFYPWFAWALVGALESSPAIQHVWARRMALALALAMAQGAFHLTSWLLGLTALVVIARPRFARTLGQVLAWFAALSAFRWLPAVVAFAHIRRPSNPGFPDLGVLASALVDIRDHTAPMIQWIGWWEYDAYIGLAAATLVVVLAIRAYAVGTPTDRALFVPVATIALLSMGDLWRPIADLPIPLVNSERGPSRFFLVPLVFAAISAAREGDRELRSRPEPLRSLLVVGAAALLAVIARDLWTHLEVWSFPHQRTPHWPRMPTSIESRHDPRYVASLAAGCAISALGWVLVAASAARGRMRARREAPRTERSRAHSGRLDPASTSNSASGTE